MTYAFRQIKSATCIILLLLGLPGLALTQVEIVVLGIAQDAGYPHAACEKKCCAKVYENPERQRHVSCIGLIDNRTSDSWIFDATPDFTHQIKVLSEVTQKPLPAGIFLTHAHIGHYTGLMYLGREGVGTVQMPVYAMPQMSQFISNNGPWSQLVSLNNIELRKIKESEAIALTPDIHVTPFKVPHRDEFSETVGYKITGPDRTAIFIPDINKWEHWSVSIVELIQDVDIALLDGSFYNGDEMPHRDISEIPHPFIVESLDLFNELPANQRSKVHFIHFNHTNPILDVESEAYKEVVSKGYNVAFEGQIIKL